MTHPSRDALEAARPRFTKEELRLLLLVTNGGYVYKGKTYQRLMPRIHDKLRAALLRETP